jgi:hypothetical protein
LGHMTEFDIAKDLICLGKTLWRIKIREQFEITFSQREK